MKTRTKKGKKEYLVKWAGYPSEQNYWFPEDDMVAPESQDLPPINSLAFGAKNSPVVLPTTAQWPKLHRFLGYDIVFWAYS